MSQQVIESIFNYCNRRCELCPFTERCSLFRHTRSYEQRHPGRSVVEQVEDNFHEFFRLLEQWCEREGIDFDEIQRQANSEETEAEIRRVDDTVQADPLQKLATAYMRGALRLVDALSNARRLRNWPPRVTEAIDTIAWNAGLVGPKIYRALTGLVSYTESSSEDVVQNDWNGSAKVSRLLVAESKDAWRMVLDTGEAAPDSPLSELVALLDRIDRGLAERFPRAMEFVRPGFDEPAVVSRID